MAQFCPFLWLCSLPLHHIFSIPASVCGHLRFFHVQDIINIAAMNIGVHALAMLHSNIQQSTVSQWKPTIIPHSHSPAGSREAHETWPESILLNFHMCKTGYITKLWQVDIKEMICSTCRFHPCKRSYLSSFSLSHSHDLEHGGSRVKIAFSMWNKEGQYLRHGRTKRFLIIISSLFMYMYMTGYY